MTFPNTIEDFKSLPSREQAKLIHELLEASDLTSTGDRYDRMMDWFLGAVDDLAMDDGFYGDDLAARYLNRLPMDARYSGGMA
jgi:hypothetical protein